MKWGLVVLVVAVCGAGTLSAAEPPKAAISAADREFFERKVRPLLSQHCFQCHSTKAKKQRGGLLLDTKGYKIDAGRREAPGEVEYHEHVVDVMHVLEGKAKVVTGGQMIGPRTVAPGEVRASAIDGGVAHDLAAGDVLAIEHGVPHQFLEVSDPFLYFVVKVEA